MSIHDLSFATEEQLITELSRRKTAKQAAVPIPLFNKDFSHLAGTVVYAVESLAKDGIPPKNYDHFIFEAAMEAVYGKDIWKWWNVVLK